MSTSTVYQNYFEVDALHAESQAYMLIFQSFTLGTYFILVMATTSILSERKQHRRTNILLLCTIYLPFIVSVVYWVANLMVCTASIKNWFVYQSGFDDARDFQSYSPLFDTLIYINYISADCTVVWRAYALCKHNYRRSLHITITFVVLTFLLVLGTIGVRVATYFSTGGPAAPPSDPLIRTVDFFQVGTVIFSIATNFMATAIITSKFWQHSRISQDIHHPYINRRYARGDRALILLIESGVLYLVASVLRLALMMIHSSWGTLSDIYAPVHYYIAGMYLTLVIILVALQKTVETTLAGFEATVSADDLGLTDGRSQDVENTSERVASRSFA